MTNTLAVAACWWFSLFLGSALALLRLLLLLGGELLSNFTYGKTTTVLDEPPYTVLPFTLLCVFCSEFTDLLT